MLKTHQFKTHCKGDSHSSKTANIILPGLMIKQRWTSLRLQAKWYSFYSNSLNYIMLIEKTHLTQVELPTVFRIQVQMHPWMLVETTHVTEFEYYFACTRKGVHLYSVMSPGKMIFAVLDLWMSALHWV